MSYDICLRTDDGSVLELRSKHSIRGGTYVLGGTTAAELNVTYNYSSFFRAVFGEAGIRTLYGMSAEDSIPVLTAAIAALHGEPDQDYWRCTEGNARQALIDLLCIAAMAVSDGHGSAAWGGD